MTVMRTSSASVIPSLSFDRSCDLAATLLAFGGHGPLAPLRFVLALTIAFMCLLGLGLGFDLGSALSFQSRLLCLVVSSFRLELALPCAIVLIMTVTFALGLTVAFGSIPFDLFLLIDNWFAALAARLALVLVRALTPQPAILSGLIISPTRYVIVVRTFDSHTVGIAELVKGRSGENVKFGVGSLRGAYDGALYD